MSSEGEVGYLTQSIRTNLRQKSPRGGIFPPECDRKYPQSLWEGWTVLVQVTRA